MAFNGTVVGSFLTTKDAKDTKVEVRFVGVLHLCVLCVLCGQTLMGLSYIFGFVSSVSLWWTRSIGRSAQSAR